VRLSEKVRAASKCGPLESDARDVGKNTWGLSTGPIIMVQFEGQLRLVFDDPWMGLFLVLSLGRDRLWDRPGRDARLIVS
jgi:hypothetical protein